MSLVLGPACNEYNKLTTELEVERACRTEAEKIATKVSYVSSTLSVCRHMCLLLCPLICVVRLSVSVCLFVKQIG